MDISAAEQLMLELVNRARLDPLAEAARHGLGDLNAGVSGTSISASGKQPLAFNTYLDQSALAHSLWMDQTDIFSHTGAGGSNVLDRAEAAGYPLNPPYIVGENLARHGNTGGINPNTIIIEQHHDLFLSPGHRTNILHEDFRDIGIAQVIGQFVQNGQSYQGSFVTNNFGSSGTHRFVTGVAYQDIDGDRFYDVGEGRQNVMFHVGGASTATRAAGGYEISLAPTGTVDATIVYGAVSSTVSIGMDGQNAKLDVLGGHLFLTSADLTLKTGIANAVALGLNDIRLTGNGAANLLEGNSGNNVLDGGIAGNDTLIAGSGQDWLIGGGGADQLNGGAGIDWVDYNRAAGLRADLGYAHLNTGIAAGDVFANIENLAGSAGADNLRGDDAANAIWARSGDDVLFGREGNDTLDGGAGDDVLVSGAGADLLIGDVGRDRAQYTDSTAGLRADLANGARNSGWASGDSYRGIEDLGGGAMGDTLLGDNATNRLFGFDGNDALQGRGGNDYLLGGGGNDWIEGGLGNDRLRGDAGADNFIFQFHRDVVLDFTDDVDQIGIRAGSWGAGSRTAQQIVDQAKLVGNDVVIDFGNGNALIIANLGDVDALRDDIFVL